MKEWMKEWTETGLVPLHKQCSLPSGGKDTQVKHITVLLQCRKQSLLKVCQAERSSNSGNTVEDSPISPCSSISLSHIVWVFSFFICFKCIFSGLFNHFYHGCFKILSDNSNISAISLLTSMGIFFLSLGLSYSWYDDWYSV